MNRGRSTGSGYEAKACSITQPLPLKAMSAFQAPEKLCFKCGNNAARTEVQESTLKRVRGQQEHQMSGQPFRDECGTLDVALKKFKQDDIKEK